MISSIALLQFLLLKFKSAHSQGMPIMHAESEYSRLVRMFFHGPDSVSNEQDGGLAIAHAQALAYFHEVLKQLESCENILIGCTNSDFAKSCGAKEKMGIQVLLANIQYLCSIINDMVS